MSHLSNDSSGSAFQNLARKARELARNQSVVSSLSVVTVAAVCAVLVHLNWETPQRALTIAVGVSATCTELAAVTGLRTLRMIAAAALGVMVTIALAHPSGALGAWVVAAVLFFVFAVCQPQRLWGRQPQG